ncbi:hypothetical protein B9479_006316, partial [Cryptococcus floricola]
MGDFVLSKLLWSYKHLKAERAKRAGNVDLPECSTHNKITHPQLPISNLEVEAISNQLTSTTAELVKEFQAKVREAQFVAIRDTASFFEGKNFEFAQAALGLDQQLRALIVR